MPRVREDGAQGLGVLGTLLVQVRSCRGARGWPQVFLRPELELVFAMREVGSFTAMICHMYTRIVARSVA